MLSDPKVREARDHSGAQFCPGDGSSSPARRTLLERRQRPTSPWRDLLGPRRRRGSRRASELANTYVDRFTIWDVTLLVSILVLNLLDALFTLLWIQRGGAEANPIMAWMLELGDEFFLAQKCFMVGIWLIVLTVHKNFRLARIGLYSLAAIYSLLLMAHISLIAQDVDPKQPLSVQLGASQHSAEQSGHGRLNSQWTLPETDRPAAAGLPKPEFAVAPPGFGTHRD